MGTNCVNCRQQTLEDIQGFDQLPRVSSDCRPMSAGGRLSICRSCGTVQKPADAKWLKETDAIYQNYALFDDPNQFDQMMFTADGVSVRRSVKVLKYLLENWNAPMEGRLLDVGSGNGAALDAFASLKKSWRLFALDITDRGAESLAAIPGFEKLYTGGIQEVDGRFDLITAIHCLEHLQSPQEMLAGIYNSLSQNGCLVVQVPDHMSNPFDLLIADHRSHFSPSILARMAEEAGFNVMLASDKLLHKEISIVAIKGEKSFVTLQTIDIDTARTAIEKRIDWLHRLLLLGLESSTSSRPFGFFGTSIAATAFANPMLERVNFFVDEDEQMIGKSWLGKPVLSTGEIPGNALVFAPMAPLIAQRLAKRFKEANFDVLIPPPLD